MPDAKARLIAQRLTVVLFGGLIVALFGTEVAEREKRRREIGAHFDGAPDEIGRLGGFAALIEHQSQYMQRIGLVGISF